MLRISSLSDDVVVLLVFVVLDPVLRSVLIGLAVLLKKTRLYQLLLSLGTRTLLPLSGVGLSVHDDSLGLSYDPMIAGADFRC
jgi:hypothetical protein